MIIETIASLETIIIKKILALYDNDLVEIARILEMDYNHVYNILKVRESIPKERLLDFLKVANYGMIILPLTEEDEENA